MADLLGAFGPARKRRSCTGKAGNEIAGTRGWRKECAVRLGKDMGLKSGTLAGNGAGEGGPLNPLRREWALRRGGGSSPKNSAPSAAREAWSGSEDPIGPATGEAAGFAGLLLSPWGDDTCPDWCFVARDSRRSFRIIITRTESSSVNCLAPFRTRVFLRSSLRIWPGFVVACATCLARV